MLATKERLKVTPFVVGVLAVGLGLYAGFQTDGAYGHTGKVPPGKDEFRSTLIKPIHKGPKVPFSAYCSQCGTSRGGYTRTYIEEIYYRYAHYHLNWKLNWVYQYTWDKYIRTRTRTPKFWDPCSNSQCPSNQN